LKFKVFYGFHDQEFESGESVSELPHLELDLELSVLHSLCVDIELLSVPLDQEVWYVLDRSDCFSFVSELILKDERYLAIEDCDIVIPEIGVHTPLES